MEYIIRKCPNCNGELHIPSDLKSCICMFCGTTFNPFEKVQENSEFLEYKTIAYKEALQRIPELIKNHVKQMEQFKRDSFSSCFQEYVIESKSILEPLEQYVQLSSKNNVSEEITQILLDDVQNSVAKGNQNKINKADLDDYRFFFAVYVVPMLLYLKYSFSETAADKIIEEWSKRYPKNTFRKGTYEEILQGFERKGFCFITTAVCDSLNKPDDCYELEAFRNFRDTYMLQTKEGKNLVYEYYQISPAIVTFINMQQNSQEQYRNIWNMYLIPCLRDIKENRFANCKNRYIEMVQNLKDDYHIS